MNSIDRIGFLPGIKAAQPERHHASSTDFGALLKQALREVNRSQQEADQLTQKLVTGEVDDLHQVMIAAEKANLQLQLTIQVRNKVVEAYQDIMRMQM
ncbi:flagellar hook-basal body complex protein FliE [Caldalkalibacillus uzonensis]|uniref:Flagellar hook-basal body complex protein FliE n=1 Tax=Caldalkalibacillus uzonensis TaxID=353224 RepID=A0ABU0CMZ2_9BACI|nr:flagellar hook-basal body complex protein FliE [Caldalkalibacillus uzonensis]MDQ0337261.1 flagellar hook-basal body complex protein FliE [Caldalkalibacillus uzonensis]